MLGSACTYGKLVLVGADKSVDLLAVLEDHECRHGLDSDFLWTRKSQESIECVSTRLYDKKFAVHT